MADFYPGAAKFDGTNDDLRRGADLTGNADSSQGVLSVWVKYNSGNGVAQRLLMNSLASGSGLDLIRDSANRFDMILGDGTNAYTFRTSATIVAGAFRHLLLSYDVNFATGARLSHLYVNDVSDRAVPTNTGIAFAVDLTATNWAVGAQPAGGSKTNADIAELWFYPGQYLDLSVVANRRKFITSDLKPVDLGADGSAPFGTPPIIYQTLRPGDLATAFAINRGTGGGWTITGALDLVTGPNGVQPPTVESAGSGPHRHPERPWTTVARPIEPAEPEISLPPPLPAEPEEAYIPRARAALEERLAVAGRLAEAEALFARLMLEQRMLWMRQEEEALLAVLMVAV